MTNQEIFEALAEMESKLFYAWCVDKTPARMEAHVAAEAALKAFAAATGCHN